MKKGIKVKSLPRDGILFAAGVRAGDFIVAVNGMDIIDELDFYYHAAQPFLEIDIIRGGREGTVEIERSAGAALVAEFYEKPVNKCANRCIFCFIDQMPEGLRRTLYIKDEDFKHSFLNGNYVTLTSASREDLRRIASIGLSPLFLSIHATEPKVRAAMLGNRRIPDVREQLAFLRDSGIGFHTQIVVCPGINDGVVLEKTVKDLFGYGQSLLSVAVVPVGLTRFRKRPLAGVDKAAALSICGTMGEISERMKARDGARKLFLADEFFIKADLAIPSAGYYEDYPQIENGVGLIRLLLTEGTKIKRKLRIGGAYIRNKNKNVLVVTGQSAFPYLKRVLADISQYVCKNYEVAGVINRYLGETVTVAGLLTARDVIRTVKESSIGKSYCEVILPAVMFNHSGYTLDGYSSKRIAKAVGLNVKTAGSIEEVL